MSEVRRTMVFTKTEDDWIKSRIESGRLSDDGDYLRRLVLHDLEDKRKLEDRRCAIQDGLGSGMAEDFDFSEFLAGINAKHG